MSETNEQETNEQETTPQESQQTEDAPALPVTESAADAETGSTTEPDTSEATGTTVVVGVNVGATKTTSATSTGGIESEVLSLRYDNLDTVMPSCLSFPGSSGGFRKFGDAAECDHGNDSNKFTHLLYLPHDKDQHDTFRSSVLCTSNLQTADKGEENNKTEDVVFELQPTGPDGNVENLPSTAIPARQALAMFLRKLYQRAVKERSENNSEESSQPSFVCSLNAPSCFSESHKARLCSAARVAGFSAARVTTNVEALAAVYLNRRVLPSADSTEFPFLVAFVDYGHAQFSVGIAAFYKPNAESTPTYRVLSEHSVVGFAGESIDLALAQHFAQQYAAKVNAQPVGLTSRKGKRLVRACRGAKHALSANEKARFMVDAMGENGDDARFEVTRSDFSKHCEVQFAALRDALTTVFNSVFSAGSETTSLEVDGQSIEFQRSDLRKVELVGGGSRSPTVQEVVTKVLDVESSQLSFTLDIRASLSRGAAVALSFTTSDGDGTAEASLRSAESEWVEMDNVNQTQHKLREDLERFISSMRTAIAESEGAPEKEKLDGTVVAPLLDEAEELTWEAWTPDFGDRCEAARIKLDGEIHKLCPGFFEAKAAAKANYEAELDKLAKEAKAEKDAAGPSDEDHDRRKLKASKRLRNANIQKKEGNELFAGKNYLPATVRYVKALKELGGDKFAGELTEEEEAERNSLLVSCQLNAAACWLKLKKPIKAEANCSQVLHLEPKNVKALFRRASARLELKKYEEANGDVKAALSIDPASKAAQKLQTKIQKVLDKRLAAKKKMASKMFGGKSKKKTSN